MSRQIKSFEFGPFYLEPRERLLLRDGEAIQLAPKVFETLVVLVEQGGRIVEKDELMKRVWPDTFVDESSLTRNISVLRKALGEDATGRGYIETVPKLGYRFTADVSMRSDGQADIIVEKRTISQTITVEDEADEIDLEPSSEQSALEAGSLINEAPLRKARWIALALSVGLAGVLLYLWISNRPKPIRDVADIKSVAVLPFIVLGTESDDQHLGLGMADTLITRLSNIRSIAVRPTSAVLRYNAADRDPVAAGRTLAVEAVLEGSIQRADDRVRVTLRLLNVRDGSPLWADKFDAKLTDILLVQDSISEHVARALTLNLTGEEKQQITKRHTRSQEAYALYVEGRYHWNKRKMDMSRAISYFQQAIEKDPDFALAYVGLADTLAMNGPPSEASFAISKAIEMDDSLGEAHASLGFIKMFHRWQWADAEREFKRAIELNPGYATAHQWYAICLAITGRIEEAKAEMRRALDIDPTSPNMNADMGQLLYFERDYDGAIAYCRKALETDPDFFFAHGYLFDIYMKKGMYDQAIESYFESVRTSFSDSAKRSLSDVKAQYMGVYRNTGIRGFLQGFIKENKNVASPYYSAWGAARCYALLDEREQALSWLEKACESHLFLVPFIAVDPIFDQLRPEPRFQSLLRRMGLKEG